MKNTKDLIKTLKESKMGSWKQERAIRLAYMDSSIEKYQIKDIICFRQGAGREVDIPFEIVEDAIGCMPVVDRRAA